MRIFCRAKKALVDLQCCLLVVVIKLFKPAPEILEFVVEDEDVDEMETDESTSAERRQRPSPHSTPTRSPSRSRVERKIVHSPSFDLSVAKISVLADTVSYGLLVVFTNPVAFVIGTILGASGAGFAAAIQSVALDLYVRGGGKGTGKCVFA